MTRGNSGVFLVSSHFGRSCKESNRLKTGGPVSQRLKTENRARVTSNMSPIKDFTLSYEALNEQDYFCAGDTVSGAVTFTLSKDTKVKSLFVKMKGDADVHWTEGSGDDKDVYSAHIRYFKLKEYLVAESTLLPKGLHRFKFRFRIPQEDMPSSFKGDYGNIVYMLEAKMSRSWRCPSGVKQDLKFVSKSILHHGQETCPQSGSVDKEMGVFSKGQVQMSASVNRKVCSPGDTLSVFAKIRNSSSKTMKPKFSLEKIVLYRASGNTNTSHKVLCKVVGDAIKPNSEETASCQLKVPDEVTYALINCPIISVEYQVKVYLDIKFAIDPEVVFPLVIIPSSFVASHPEEAVGYSDFPPPVFPTGSFPEPAGPSAYGYPALDPTQQANTTSGYDNQWPQQAPPYGYPSAAFPPSSVQYQAPTAPPLSQQGGGPPAYTSFFSLSDDTVGSTGSDLKK